MSGSIRKYQSMVAFPKTKYDNQIYFDVGNEGGQIDMASSYLELQVSLNDASGNPITDYTNVVLGHDGMYYNASALFRSAKLSESRTGKVIQDLVYVNMLSNNLEYFAKGANRVVSDALYSGQGAASVNGIVSVFNNEYQDETPVIRCPLSLLYPGSVGQADMLPQQADLEYRYLLEPQYNVFMRAVESGVYGVGEVSSPDSGVFDNVDATELIATASALATVVPANYPTENCAVVISCLLGGVETYVARNVIVNYDNGLTEGYLELDAVLSMTENATVVSITPVNDTNKLTCYATQPSQTVLTFQADTTGNTTNTDLYVGTQVQVYYKTLNASTGVLTDQSLVTTITAMGVDGTDIETITLANALSTTYQCVGIHIVPISNNLDSYNWVVSNAHLVIYRRMMDMKAPSEMLVSNFESVNVGMVGGLNRFMYSLKARENTYNMYVLTPNQTNLYSQLEGLQTYQISVNDKPLTTIYLDASGSALHLDNMLRTLSNSEVYKPKNLSVYRDQEIETLVEPVMFPAKLYASTVKGESNVQDFNNQDKNVKVELVASNGSTTPQKMVYMFLEKFDRV